MSQVHDDEELLNGAGDREQELDEVERGVHTEAVQTMQQDVEDATAPPRRSVRQEAVQTMRQDVEDATAPPRRSVRQRTLTDKGTFYQMELLHSQRGKLYRQLCSKRDSINRALYDVSRSELQIMYAHWINLYDMFLDANEDYCNLKLSDEDRDEWFTEKEMEFNEFKQSVEGMLLSKVIKTEKVPQSTENTQKKVKVSEHSKQKTVVESSVQKYVSKGSVQKGVLDKGEQRVHTGVKVNENVHKLEQLNDDIKSHNSGSGRGSSVSMASEKLVEQQKMAELEVKKNALQKKKELALRQLDLEMEAEQLKLEEEIAITEARSKILDDVEHRSVSSVNRKPQDQVSVHRREGFSYQNPAPTHRQEVPISALNPDASSFVPEQPPPRSTGGDSTPEVMFSMVKHLRKPQVEIAKFDGNPLHFRKFMRQFQARVINNTDDADEIMTYLEQLTVGEVNKIVVSFSHLNARHGLNVVLREFEDRYGDPEVIASSYIQKALSWPVIKPNDSKALDDFSVFLVECENAVGSLHTMRMLEFPDTMQKLLGKLPFYLHDRWRSMVQQAKESHKHVSFHMFVDFVKRESLKANHPIYGKDAISTDQSKGKQPRPRLRGNFGNTSEDNASSKTTMQQQAPATTSPPNPDGKKSPCMFCGGGHSLHSCWKLMSKPSSDRIQFLRSKRLCFGCLRPGHQKQSCRNRSVCRKCNRNHPTVLHIDNFNPNQMAGGSNQQVVSSPAGPRAKQDEPPQNVTATTSAGQESAPVSSIQSYVGVSSNKYTFTILPVRIHVKGHCTAVDTYAFLDTGSNVTFCSQRLMERLGATGRKRRINIDTMGSPQSLITYQLKGLVLSDLNNEHSIELDQVYTKESIPATSDHIPQQSDLQCWPHLQDIALPQIDGGIDLLIGNNVPDAYTPLEIRTGPSGSPYASRTRLGWTIYNLMRLNQSDIPHCHRAEVSAFEEFEENQNLETMMKQFINMEFPDSSHERKEPSVEDELFLTMVHKSMKLVDNHYMMCLPFRDENVKLPDNRPQAEQRLVSLKKKFDKNEQFYTDYVTFMNKILSKGFAEEVPETELSRDDGRVWYIPHHGVYHPHKPGKIRVVFDCAATYFGISLNQLLLSGPDLTNSLLGVLMRFRQENIAIMGDIESMFYQVRVSKNDTDCLRFLWWPGGDLNETPKVYRMIVHLFGAVSSPACANVALKQTAEDNKHLYDSDVYDAVLKDFYVDDFLKSLSNDPEAVSMVKNVSDLCSHGGFNVTQWTSNSCEIIKSIPSGKRTKQLQEIDIDHVGLPSERALGVNWAVGSDQFYFEPSDRKLLKITRRSMLSLIGSVFDPIGFISPFILIGKILLRDLCGRDVPWDQEITGEDLDKWHKWEVGLEELDQCRIPRCLKPASMQNVMSCELHHFCDASNVGYGVVTYLRMLSDSGQIHCSFLLSRARVSPLKRATVPRLELTAATSAVRLHQKIVEEFDYKIDRVYYWTDSMSVLRYLWNRKTRFLTFVANRVSFIREASDISQWHFVPTEINPADIVSRGSDVKSLFQSDKWQKGPDFLWQDQSSWPEQPNSSAIPEEDPEVKKHVNVAVIPDNLLAHMMVKFSTWWQLKKVVAWLLKFRESLRSWVSLRRELLQSKDQSMDPVELNAAINDEMKQMKIDAMRQSQKQMKTMQLSVDLLQQAEKAICRVEQQRFFSSEISTIEDRKSIPRSSSLYSLDPIIEDGLLRVGGRLKKANLKFDVKHPIILPAQSPVSLLILMNGHEVVGHLGKNAILAEVRQKFWIPGANSLIKTLLSKCVVCRRYRGKCMEQKMADLPVDRTVAGEPPFTRTGMDFFGPFEVKRGRSIVKRYGVVFTCLACRAIHLEVAHSLDTSSCINAIRRFTSRRGPVKIIWSDNGTNLVGAERELREELAKCEESQVHKTLLQREIQWHFNPPTASHFGGIWERMIRTVRKVLYALMRQQMLNLDDESLATLFCEVESIVNSRPITTTNSDVADIDVLTPNHLLLLKGSHLPIGVSCSSDNYSRRRWKQVQYLADIFWTRWSKEYLASLQQRQKWVQSRKNMTIGDIVLLADSKPRSAWDLGKIVKVESDRHGVVRVAHIQTRNTVLRRPVHKLCVLLESELNNA